VSACRPYLALLDAFADGELPPDKTLDVEQHLAACGTCRERLRLTDALRVSTRRAVTRSAVVGPDLLARVREGMAAERAREAERRAPARSDVLSWRAIFPIAAAAGVALFVAASYRDRDDPPRRIVPAAPSALVVSNLLDDIVENHLSATEPEVTETSLVPELEPRVGVPVRLPRLAEYGARWEGGSVVPVHDQRAASLRYRMHGHRVTVYVYDARRVPLRTELEARVVRNTPVFVGQRRGYSIAAVERAGVGQAVTTDMSDDESAELIVAALH
jgi:anti-sigma factor RsiW